MIILYGLAVAKSQVYPAWLSWVAVVLGVLSVLETLWILVMGVQLGRRAAAVKGI